MLKGLCERLSGDKLEAVERLNDFLRILRLDHLNFFEIDRFMEESRICVKIQAVMGAADGKTSFTAPQHSGGAETSDDCQISTTTSHLSPLHNLRSFLSALMNDDDDGRVVVHIMGNECVDVSVDATALASTTTTTTSHPSSTDSFFKFILLNPSSAFSEIVQHAKSVILVGGTMEPISDFKANLFPLMDNNRFHHFACNHVIPRANLQTLIVANGHQGVHLEYKHSTKNIPSLIHSIGHSLLQLCRVIPKGVVVFMPSYAALDSFMASWRGGARSTDHTGNPLNPTPPSILCQIAVHKKVYVEPRTKVEVTLDAYSKDAVTTGAVLFCVIGGKLSEGIK